MNTYHFPKLNKIKSIEGNFSKYSELSKAFNFFEPPYGVFNLMFQNYLSKDNKEFLSHVFYWDLGKPNSQNNSDLFNLIDSCIYMCKPFDYQPFNIWNPIKELEKNKCFSEDIINIEIVDLILEKRVGEYRFKRSSFSNLALHNLIFSIEEYIYNKKLKVSYKYIVSKEAKEYIDRVDLQKIQKYEFSVFEKIKLNTFFYLNKSVDLNTPKDEIEESEFISHIEKIISDSKKYPLNLLFLKKYKESKSIEYLMAINHDFESYSIQGIICFHDLKHLIIELLFKSFWNKNDKQ